jgi:hypothetical protein
VATARIPRLDEVRAVTGEWAQFRFGHATNQQGRRTWFWRLIDDFGLTLASQSEQFPDEDAAKKAAKWVRNPRSRARLR